jgi:hypothetical protein
MKAPESIPVQITSARDHHSEGTVSLQSWEKKERTARAFKALGFTWIGAIVAVFLPLLHFVLVPALLVAGPLLFFWVAGREQVILGGKGTCPDCGKEFEIVRSPVKWPLTDLCNHCQARVKIAPRA